MNDIYIMMQCVFICNEKWSLSPSELSAGGAKLDGRKALPVVGRLWPSNDNDGDNDSDKDKECRCPIVGAAFAPQTIY